MKKKVGQKKAMPMKKSGSKKKGMAAKIAKAMSK